MYVHCTVGILNEIRNKCDIFIQVFFINIYTNKTTLHINDYDMIIMTFTILNNVILVLAPHQEEFIEYHHILFNMEIIEEINKALRHVENLFIQRFYFFI